MDSKKTDPSSVAATYSCAAFSTFAQVQALALKIESAPAFDFSEQTRSALDGARADPSVPNLAVACRLAAGELEGHAALGELVKTLSLAIALPVPGTRGAANLIYPVLGTGLATATGESGEEAALKFFSRARHTLDGAPAPVEAWDQAAIDVNRREAPAAYLIGREAKITYARLKAESEEDYLSARWGQMSLSGRDIQRQESLRFLMSEEAHSEYKNLDRRDSMFDDARLGTTRALGKILRAQSKLMRALEGGDPKTPGVFELAAEAWRQLKNKKEKQKKNRFEDRALGDIDWEALRRVEHLLDRVAYQNPASAERSNLSRWFKEELPKWEALKKIEGGWSRQRIEKFKSELDEGRVLSFGKQALEQRGSGRASAWDSFVAAAIYLIVSPPEAMEASDGDSSMLAVLQDLDRLSREGARESSLNARRGGNQRDQGMFGGVAGFGVPDGADTVWAVRNLFEAARDAMRFKKTARLEGEGPAEPIKSDWDGIGQWLELGDECLLAAASMARRREIAAMESMGLISSADVLRGEESKDEASESQISFRALIFAESKRRALEQTDAMAKAFGLHGQMVAPRGEMTRLESATREHAARSGSKEEMEAFFKSPMGSVYASALSVLIDHMEKNPNQAAYASHAAGVWYQAGLQEFRDPSSTPGLLSQWPMSETDKTEMTRVCMSLCDPRSSFCKVAGSLHELTRAPAWGAAPKLWETALDVLGSKAGVDYLLERAEAIERQCPKAALWLVESALGVKPRDSEPKIETLSLKKHNVNFPSLPYGHAADLRLRALSSAGEDPLALEDAAVVAQLKKEGFAGEAALAAKACYGEIETREGADDRSRANAWLAAGKRLCKEELGLTEGSYQAAQAHAPTAKRLASLFPRLIKTKVALRESQGNAALDPSAGLAKPARKALRLSGLLNAALSRSMPASWAYVAGEAMEPGQPSSGELEINAWYLSKAFEPLSSGVSVSQALRAIKRELSACEALRERLDGALLERAGELLKSAESGKDKKSAGQMERSAITVLRDDLTRVNDWANDSSGAFFTRLNPKPRWAHLSRGEKDWHEEQIAREASSGAGWEAALGSWKSEEGEWTAEELLTPKALSAEGASMRHCVGSYSSHCREGSSRIFSIRRNGVRALTAQFDLSDGKSSNGRLPTTAGRWKLTQNKGPCNASPSKEGALTTQRLAEALQQKWDLRLKETLENKVKGLGEISVVKGEEFEAPGFNPDLALDLSKLRRSRTSDNTLGLEPGGSANATKTAKGGGAG